MRQTLLPDIDMQRSLQWRRMLWIATLVSFCSMFFFNFFIEGFIITVSVIVLPVLLYWYKQERLLLLGVILGVASPGFRWFTLLLSGHTGQEALGMVWPEFFFYVCYASIYHFWYLGGRRQLGNFAAAVFFCDFVSNWLEMGLRLGTPLIPFEILRGLGAIAVVRTGVVLLLVATVIGLQRYFQREAQAAHYQKLLMMTSNFWSEMYFLEKNALYIENLMAKAFKLYHHANKLPMAPTEKSELVELALEVAKEVHEVKKDYLRVIKGLEAITERRLFDLEMGMADILRVVIENTRHCLEAESGADGKSESKGATRIHFVERLHSNAPVRYHFYMTSVVRNLIGNALEALEAQSVGTITIDLVEDQDTVTLMVSDNGSGIQEKNLPFIFSPGFSTKYACETGESRRGVGLVVVKSLVEQVFCGTIQVNTVVDKGTTFTLTFQAACLKEGKPCASTC